MAPLLIGIDEGTTGVKAVLYDERLTPLREARRRKQSRHPHPGWVEQDPEEILDSVVDAVAELLEDAPGEVVGCGLDHQGESVLAWDGETGRPADAGRGVAGQAPDRAAGDARRGVDPRAQRAAARPLLLGRQARLAAAERRRARGRAARQRRRLADRPPRRRLRHRRLDRLAHPAAPARRRGLGPVAVRDVRRADRRAAADRRQRRRARHAAS